MVLIVGQYSVGKSSFIRSLLKRDFPGLRIGPEPTTDRFVAVMHGEEEGVIPGHALAMQSGKPFRSLQASGPSFSRPGSTLLGSWLSFFFSISHLWTHTGLEKAFLQLQDQAAAGRLMVHRSPWFLFLKPAFSANRPLSALPVLTL
ncbi:unnamed protein product [Phaeothamnion confervicola]